MIRAGSASMPSPGSPPGATMRAEELASAAARTGGDMASFAPAMTTIELAVLRDRHDRQSRQRLRDMAEVDAGLARSLDSAAAYAWRRLRRHPPC